MRRVLLKSSDNVIMHFADRWVVFDFTTALSLHSDDTHYHFTLSLAASKYRRHQYITETVLSIHSSILLFVYFAFIIYN